VVQKGDSSPLNATGLERNYFFNYQLKTPCTPVYFEQLLLWTTLFSGTGGQHKVRETAGQTGLVALFLLSLVPAVHHSLLHSTPGYVENYVCMGLAIGQCYGQDTCRNMTAGAYVAWRTQECGHLAVKLSYVLIICLSMALRKLGIPGWLIRVESPTEPDGSVPEHIEYTPESTRNWRAQKASRVVSAMGIFLSAHIGIFF
jgi:hypothetical protein